jgi:serine/threonine-protein kinase RsbW
MLCVRYRGNTGTTTCVAIDTHPRPVGSLQLEVVATAGRLSEIRHELLAWLEQMGMSGTDSADIVLVVNEAATNSVEHAYRDVDPGLIRVEADVHAGQIVIGIADFGVWQPPTHQTSTRGRGLAIMQAVSDRMEVDHTPSGTTVLITFEFGAAIEN